jgi:ribosome-associated protein
LKATTLTSEEKRDAIIAAAEDKKANYITPIDVRGKTVITDFHIICSGTSNIHIRSVAEGIIEAMDKIGIRKKRMEGLGESTWVIVDYGDVFVHVMSDDERARFNLEKLWTIEAQVDATGSTILKDSSPEVTVDATAG